MVRMAKLLLRILACLLLPNLKSLCALFTTTHTLFLSSFRQSVCAYLFLLLWINIFVVGIQDSHQGELIMNGRRFIMVYNNIPGAIRQPIFLVRETSLQLFVLYHNLIIRCTIHSFLCFSQLTGAVC